MSDTEKADLGLQISQAREVLESTLPSLFSSDSEGALLRGHIAAFVMRCKKLRLCCRCLNEYSDALNISYIGQSIALSGEPLDYELVYNLDVVIGEEQEPHGERLLPLAVAGDCVYRQNVMMYHYLDVSFDVVEFDESHVPRFRRVSGRVQHPRICLGFMQMYQALNGLSGDEIRDRNALTIRSTVTTPKRNSLCPCGKPLKYKRCCGKNV